MTKANEECIDGRFRCKPGHVKDTNGICQGLNVTTINLFLMIAEIDEMCVIIFLFVFSYAR